MLKNLSPAERQEVQEAIFPSDVDESLRRQVLLMLTQYDLNNEILTSFLLTKIGEGKLASDTMDILMGYESAEATSRKKTEKASKAPKADKPPKVAKAPKPPKLPTAPKVAKTPKPHKEKKNKFPVFHFGNVNLMETPAYSCRSASKMYSLAKNLYHPQDVISRFFIACTEGWCTYEHLVHLAAMLHDLHIMEDWETELVKFFNGSCRKFGWEGEKDVDERGHIVIHIKPTDDWNGTTIPEGIQEWNKHE